MDSLVFLLVLLSAVGSGISAGLFFIFSNTIMNALAKLPPAHGIASMVSINRVILNPVFFLVFMGTAVTSALLILILIWYWGYPGSIYILLGALLYLVGSFLVTIVFNVPMNNALDAASPDTAEASDLWSDYLKNWTAWNHVRTVACILSMLAFILALA